MICSQCGVDGSLGMSYHKRYCCRACAIRLGIWESKVYKSEKQLDDREAMKQASRIRKH